MDKVKIIYKQGDLSLVFLEKSVKINFRLYRLCINKIKVNIKGEYYEKVRYISIISNHFIWFDSL